MGANNTPKLEYLCGGVQNSIAFIHFATYNTGYAFGAAYSLKYEEAFIHL